MNINYKEPQFELFPANSATLEDINKPRFLLATMTLSTENLVILVVLGIMIAVFSFSIGVERGKHVAAQSLDEKAAAAWNVGGRRLAAVAAAPVAASNPVAVKTPAMAPVKAVHKPGNKGVVQTNQASSTNARWTVQLSTYRSEKFAQQEALGLKAKGYPVFLIKSKDFYLVCIGQYNAQSQADSFLKKIQAKYQGSQVRRF